MNFVSNPFQKWEVKHFCEWFLLTIADAMLSLKVWESNVREAVEVAAAPTPLNIRITKEYATNVSLVGIRCTNLKIDTSIQKRIGGLGIKTVASSRIKIIKNI